jgi:hypothetical protein
MHFRLDKQQAFIQGHGQSVVIFPVMQCPCLLEDKQFSPICVICHGTGRYYPDGMAYSTTLLMHQEDSMRTYLEAGTWTHGTIRATVLPGIRLSERDKVLMQDVKDDYADEILTRGLLEQLRFSHGVELDVIVDQSTIYTPGVDYVLSPPNTVAWVPGGQSPAFGAQYSCKYSAFPEFLVVNDSPRLRVEHRTTQGQEVMLMRLDKLSTEW